MRNFSINDIKSRLNSLGYKFFERGDYNLNIIGIRNKVLSTNTFNDELHCIYKVNGNWVDDVYPITTDPGKKSLTNPENKKGCAILVPGQYPGSHKLGLHKGDYLALVQNKPIKVYRDGNKDEVMDIDQSTIDNGIFGINIHKAGTDSTYVDKWSAGCQVFKKESDFNKFIQVCSKAAEKFGNSFTYTLLDEW